MFDAPVSIGSAAVANGTALQHQPVTTGVIVAAGDAIILCFDIYRSIIGFTSVTDGTNTYTVRHVTAPNGFDVGIAYCLSSAGLASGSNIVVNLAGVPGVGYFAARALKVPHGLLALDVSATTTQTTTAALSVGPTATTTTLIDLILAVFGGYNSSASIPSFTVGAGYTTLTGVTAVAGSDAVGLWPEYLITAAAGAQTATGTLGASITSLGDVIAAFTYPPSITGATADPPTAAAVYSAGTPTAVAI